MENIITFAIPILLGFLVLKILFTPMKWAIKLAMHAACGFVCLWLLNSISGFTGLELPINAATTLISGVFGVPGIALIALLEIL
jgi:pro-sigmaK processing inhibitor BofA